ncbi:hypothetical protein QO002_003242 [Pararhizobium capsulatum DSM 1112]|uniref:GNAT family N-acetyltransferase n=1 Tax=Pararhizobium capsulatum DSM 1112 TaxID=1121113 RepID=A0ABU0BS82_9HYPH|nr:hypothetical protein [Pararhizobium capsulatum]MDQ0321104.1 hypothetical protein [Pararhizobium capsulatum DSM 1112]
MLNELPRDGVVQPYRLGTDDPDVLRLRAAVWGKDHPHTDERFFEWLLRRNPVEAGSGSLIRQAGQVVAFAGLSPRMLLMNGTPLRTAHGLDLMVDPDLGGMLSGRYGFKVSDAWARQAREAGFAFGVVFPNVNSFRLLTSGRLKWQVVLEPHLRARPLRGFASKETILARIPAWMTHVSTTTLVAGLDVLQSLKRNPKGRAIDLGQADERLDALWQRAAGHIQTGFVRDQAYVNWRYFAHPLYKYRVHAWEVDGRLTAFLVTTTREILGLKSLLIVDALSEDGNPAALSALIRHASHKGAREGMELCVAQSCQGNLLDRALAKSGFFAVPQKYNPKRFFLAGLVLSPEAEGALKTGGWHFTWGDMDVV